MTVRRLVDFLLVANLSASIFSLSKLVSYSMPVWALWSSSLGIVLFMTGLALWKGVKLDNYKIILLAGIAIGYVLVCL